MDYIEFQGEDNIEMVSDFLGDRLTERIIDSSKDSQLVAITFRSNQGLLTIPVGTFIKRNPVGTFSAMIPAATKLGDHHVCPM